MKRRTKAEVKSKKGDDGENGENSGFYRGGIYGAWFGFVLGGRGGNGSDTEIPATGNAGVLTLIVCMAASGLIALKMRKVYNERKG